MKDKLDGERKMLVSGIIMPKKNFIEYKDLAERARAGWKEKLVETKGMQLIYESTVQSAFRTIEFEKLKIEDCQLVDELCGINRINLDSTYAYKSAFSMLKLMKKERNKGSINQEKRDKLEKGLKQGTIMEIPGDRRG